MGKLVFLAIVLIFILVFPIYENSRIHITGEKNIKNKIPIAKIIDGNFSIYDKNLTKLGELKTLNIFKKEYTSKFLSITDLIKKEKFFAKKAILKNKILKAYDFKYKNDKYALFSIFVLYNLKTKNIKGDKFFLYSEDYNASGKNFYIDSKRDIKAIDISFYLKVKK